MVGVSQKTCLIVQIMAFGEKANDLLIIIQKNFTGVAEHIL